MRRIILNVIKRYLSLLLFLFLTSMGIGLAIKAKIGLAAFDAFNQTISDTIGLQVGTVVMIVQIFFVFLQIVVLKKEATLKIFLQIPLVILLGQFINFFVYYVFGSLTFDYYIIRLIVFIFSQFWISFFIGTILTIDLIAMPIEHLSLLLSKRSTFSIGQIRQSIDILLILFSLVITFIFSVPLNIREGTLISALVFGPMLGFFMPRIKLYFKKWQLIGK